MGHWELLAALRREGEQKAAAIRAAAEAEAAQLREAASIRLDELRTSHDRHQEALRAYRRRELLAEAEQQARAVRLAAEHRLALRLRQCAAARLRALGDERCEHLFRGVARELPAETWATVRVNPRDVRVAGLLFPAAVIEADARIMGGFEAATPGDEFRVVTTIEARLERAWSDLLPEVIAELRSVVGEGDAVRNTARRP